MSNNLRKLRGKHQLTVTELATKIGLSKQAVSFYEIGKAPLCVETAYKISKVLKENVFSILGSDVLKIIPKTEKEKEIIIEMIRSL